jgi:hypothetical protein
MIRHLMRINCELVSVEHVRDYFYSEESVMRIALQREEYE